MILSILFLVLFFIIVSFVLLFLFAVLLPALKVEKFGIQNTVFSDKEINYVEKKIDTTVPDLSKTAVITNTDKKDESKRRLVYDGLKNCTLFFSTYESEYTGLMPCAGFGDCIEVCPQHAITIKNGVAVVDQLCDGCGQCISICPHKIISLIQNSKKNSMPEKKHFKFWNTWYSIVGRRS